MDEVEFINLPNDTNLTRVTKELHGRGYVYAALDSRRTFLILSQRLRNTQVAIEELANEEVCLASLYECANHLCRKGKCGSFRIEKMDLHTLPAWLERERGRHARVVVAATCTRCWELQRADAQRS